MSIRVCPHCGRSFSADPSIGALCLACQAEPGRAPSAASPQDQTLLLSDARTALLTPDPGAATIMDHPGAATIMDRPGASRFAIDHAASQAQRSMAAAPGAPPSDGSPGDAAPGRTLRQYADGVLTTEGGERVTAAAAGQRVVALPYRASDVLTRIGPYDVLAELGRGGMGVVYRAYSIRLCRPCALKVLTAGAHASEAESARFRNEALLAAGLNHPNIVAVFDAGEHRGLSYFVMELVAGKGLTALLGQRGDEPLKLGLSVLIKVARALEYAHSRGIIHRDIKPDNILIDAQGEPHITDFGIAKSLEQDQGMTVAGAAIGTPCYMPPEQANGEIRNIGPASDVYALGATLYHLLTGRPPFEGAGPFAILALVLRKEPEPPREVARRQLGRDLPPDLETICLKAMEKQAQRRYPSAGAFADDLEAHLQDRPISARPISTTERAYKLLRRNRTAFIGGLVVTCTLLVMALGFGTVILYNLQRTSASLRDQDRQAGVDQALTLERSIRATMLHGRADVARELVAQLRQDPGISSVDVVRTDRTLAYADLRTRQRVAERLSDPRALAWIQRSLAGMLPKIAEVQRVAFANIDANQQPDRLFAFDPGRWAELLRSDAVVTQVEGRGGEPVLTVLKPIVNSPKCQACHGQEDEPGYGRNHVRAVLVVRRSQRDVEQRIHKNQLATLVVAGCTTVLLLLLLLVISRLFGIGPRPIQFGRRAAA